MKESIKSIAEWSEHTFPDATLDGQLQKFKDEKREWWDSERDDILELADMFIVACSLTRFNSPEAMFCFGRVEEELCHSAFVTQDLEKAVDEKMAINRKRQWNFSNGQYQHKGSTK